MPIKGTNLISPLTLFTSDYPVSTDIKKKRRKKRHLLHQIYTLNNHKHVKRKRPQDSTKKKRKSPNSPIKTPKNGGKSQDPEREATGFEDPNLSGDR